MTEKCLIIAEIAQAHDGSLGTAHAYIDAVALAGADAIKFQTHYADEESSTAEPWRVKFSLQDDSRFDYWKRMEFTAEQWKGLADHAHAKGLLFISSPFSEKAVNVLLEAGVDYFKIASGEITNLPLLEAIAETGKPVLLSGGMSTKAEMHEAISLFKQKSVPVLVFQCTTNYPVAPEKIGLNLLQEYKNEFGVPVGLSDHSGAIFAGLAAVTLGAGALEVHVTFSRQMFGPDVPASITTDELFQLVAGTRWIERALANPLNKDSIAGEFSELRSIFMKSIVLNVSVTAGTVIEKSMLSFKKPAKGIPAKEYHSVVGKKAIRDLSVGHFLLKEDIEATCN